MGMRLARSVCIAITASYLFAGLWESSFRSPFAWVAFAAFFGVLFFRQRGNGVKLGGSQKEGVSGESFVKN